MNEVIRQYGAAAIAALLVLAVIGLITSEDTSVVSAVGGISERCISDDSMDGAAAVSAVADTSRSIQPGARVSMATAGIEYTIPELMDAGGGEISVISVKPVGGSRASRRESCTHDVLVTRMDSDTAVQYLCFPDEGRYAVRYRAVDYGSGAEHIGSLMICVRSGM